MVFVDVSYPQTSQGGLIVIFFALRRLADRGKRKNPLNE
jgi:hypothetical protein